MAKKRGEPRKYSIPTSFEQARDELFSHILRCGVLEASLEHQKEWFDDTLLYLADRFTDLTETELNELRVLGERYCRPVVARPSTGGAKALGLAPPWRKPSRAPAPVDAHAAGEPQLHVQALAPARGALASEQHGQESLPWSAAPRGERTTHAGVEAGSPSSRGVHEQLQGELRARRRAFSDRPAGERQREAALATGTMGEAQLRTGECATSDHRRGAEAQLRRGELL